MRPLRKAVLRGSGMVVSTKYTKATKGTRCFSCLWCVSWTALFTIMPFCRGLRMRFFRYRCGSAMFAAISLGNRESSIGNLPNRSAFALRPANHASCDEIGGGGEHR